jgi:hypothetical protein
VQCAIRATSSLQLSVVTNLVHSPSPQPPKGTSGPERQQRKIERIVVELPPSTSHADGAIQTRD